MLTRTILLCAALFSAPLAQALGLGGITGNGGIGERLDAFRKERLAQHGLGLDGQAEASIRALLDTHGDDPWLLAEAHAFRGEHDEAFAALQAGARLPGRLPWQNRGRHVRWLVPHSPFLQPLKADPRWQRWRDTLDEARGGRGRG